MLLTVPCYSLFQSCTDYAKKSFQKKKIVFLIFTENKSNYKWGSLSTKERSCSPRQKSLNPQEWLGSKWGRRMTSLNGSTWGQACDPASSHGAAVASINLLRRNQDRWVKIFYTEGKDVNKRTREGNGEGGKGGRNIEKRKKNRKNEKRTKRKLEKNGKQMGTHLLMGQNS